MVQYLFETGPQGTALSNANSGSTASSMTGSTAIFDAASKAHGAFGAKFTNGAGFNGYRRYPFTTPTNEWRASIMIKTPTAAPAANLIVASFCNTGGAGRLQILIDPSLRFAVQGASGSGIAPITAAVSPNTYYRVFLSVDGGSATASVVNAKVFSEASGVWNTQVGSTWTSSTYNTGTDDVVGVDIGIVSSPAGSISVAIDDIQLLNGLGAEISDVVDFLPTPQPVLSAATNPTTVNGTNGTQVITWPTVAGAASYEAWIANKLSPLQNEYTLVATGVTSPYTFTGLSPEIDYTFGIKAKA